MRSLNTRLNLILFAASMLFSMIVFAKSNYSFRVQCTKQGQSDFNTVKDLVPNKEVFYDQMGTAIVFSGGFYSDYFEAMEIMDEAIDAGADNAFIRVFQNNQYVSDKASEALLRHILNGTLLPKWYIDEIEAQSRKDAKKVDYGVNKGKGGSSSGVKITQKKIVRSKVAKESQLDAKDRRIGKDGKDQGPSAKTVRKINKKTIVQARENGDKRLARRIELNLELDSLRRDSIKIAKAKAARAERLRKEALIAAQYQKDSLDSARIANNPKLQKKLIKEQKKKSKALAKKRKAEEKAEEKRLKDYQKSISSQMDLMDRRHRIRRSLDELQSEEEESKVVKVEADDSGLSAKENKNEREGIASSSVSEEGEIINNAKEEQNQKALEDAGDLISHDAEIAMQKANDADLEKSTENEETNSSNVSNAIAVSNIEVKPPAKSKEEIKEEKKRAKVIAKLLKEREKLAEQEAKARLARRKKEEKAQKKRMKKARKEAEKLVKEGGSSTDVMAMANTDADKDESKLNLNYNGSGEMNGNGAVASAGSSSESESSVVEGNDEASAAVEEASEEEEEIVPERLDFQVLEAPVFKILVGKEKIEQKNSLSLAHLPYIVYSENVRNYRYFTTGNYKKYEEAAAVLRELKMDDRNSKCKVIGSYRGNFVSKKMAVDLANEYRIQNE